jgi:hypothetical protein
MPETQLDVEFLFEMTAEMGDVSHALIRSGPTGHRYIAPVSGGHFEGPRLKGTIVPPGGDWVHSRTDRSAHLDVRLQLVTDDGQSILMTYQGIGVPGDEGLSIRSAPTFEAGDGDYAWLNNVQAVGIGLSTGDSVTYQVYALK